MRDSRDNPDIRKRALESKMGRMVVGSYTPRSINECQVAGLLATQRLRASKVIGRDEMAYAQISVESYYLRAFRTREAAIRRAVKDSDEVPVTWDEVKPYSDSHLVHDTRVLVDEILRQEVEE